MKRKKSARQKLREKIDKPFEHWIRIRDGWKCITCNVYIPDNKRYMHAGHFISRGNETVRYDEENVNAQCSKCNARESFSNDKSKYALAHIKKYGIKKHKALIFRANQPSKYTMASLKDLLVYWKNKLKEVITC